ncbi:BnaA10g27300D [Brassica napus]|uniref:(rape) hypothetical protein n=1 Tax=Brassica napus TaxID=3708 RepID=A0A078HU91_BRANA|nr:unnamed protein product [Brassica napus]CDY40338.1 BnaA10g27300D [Brassica napus]
MGLLFSFFEYYSDTEHHNHFTNIKLVPTRTKLGF